MQSSRSETGSQAAQHGALVHAINREKHGKSLSAYSREAITWRQVWHLSKDQMQLLKGR